MSCLSPRRISLRSSAGFFPVTATADVAEPASTVDRAEGSTRTTVTRQDLDDALQAHAVLTRPDDRAQPTPAAVWREFAAVAARIPDRRAAWTEMLRMIANRLDLDACSLFGLDRSTGELVLSATMGLNQGSVGTIRLRFHQGLVGLVAQRLQPVYVANAPSHPRFRHFPEAGEDLYQSFFGIPLLWHGEFCGVLVVHSVEPRDFTLDWAALATAAHRLSPLVAT
ncbi:GAF domain-containing protein [bacterium]|nr:GAF domain-containing protein [bacterium]